MSYSTCVWKLLPYQEKRKRGNGSCEGAMAGVSSFEIARMGILKFCLVIALGRPLHSWIMSLIKRLYSGRLPIREENRPPRLQFLFFTLPDFDRNEENRPMNIQIWPIGLDPMVEMRN
jgi:hypothetical protein